MWLWWLRQNTATPTWKAFLHSLVQHICPGPPKGHAVSQRWCHCLSGMTAKEKQNSHQTLLFQAKKKETIISGQCDVPHLPIHNSSWNVLSVFLNSFFFCWKKMEAMLWLPSSLRMCVLDMEEDMEGRPILLWVSWVYRARRELYAGHAHQHGCCLTESCLAKTRGCAGKRRRGGIQLCLHSGGDSALQESYIRFGWSWCENMIILED